MLLLFVELLLCFCALAIRAVPVSQASQQLSGDFLISHLVAHSPFQARPNSTASSFIWFDFSDQDTLAVAPTRCIVQWPVGLTPETGTSACANSSFVANIPDKRYFGVQNFTLDLSHRYIDNSVGDSPYNIVTKTGSLNLTYSVTENYKCNLWRGFCSAKADVSYLAPVNGTIA